MSDTLLCAKKAWSLTLLVQPLSPQAPISIPIDLRELVYLPTACFVALALAVPLASWTPNNKLLGFVLLLLDPLLIVLVAQPQLSVLGRHGSRCVRSSLGS